MKNQKKQSSKPTIISNENYTINFHAEHGPAILDAKGRHIEDVIQRIAARKEIIAYFQNNLLKSMEEACQKDLATTEEVAGKNGIAMEEYIQSPIKIGEIKNNNEVYAGISAITNTRMYVMPEDSGVMTFDGALGYAQTLNQKFGYNSNKMQNGVFAHIDSKKDNGWRLPMRMELEQLYENKNEIGNFSNDSYWSLSLRWDEDPIEMRTPYRVVQDFKGSFNGEYRSHDDKQHWYNRKDKASVRYIRTELR